MSLHSRRGALLAALRGIGWPLVLGSAACGGFYGMIYQGPLNTAAMHRYFASHPVSLVATGMFFVGLAALLLKLLNVLGQYRSLGRVVLPEGPADAAGRAEDCERLRDALERLPARIRASYLANRLYEALEHVQRQGPAARLDEELKYLADVDAARQQDSYALVRIIIWATPMLGFLGTVVGITRALGDLDPQQLATAIQTAMEGLLAGLYIAFDTTALALSLSIVLMFVQFFVDRMETQLLAAVDARASEELAGRFPQMGGHADPHVAVVQQMAESVVRTTEKLVRRQTELWQATVDAAHRQWSALTHTSAEQLQTSLRDALSGALGDFAGRLAKTERAAAEQAQHRWEQWQTALSDNARIMHAQQVELARQGEIMNQVVRATGEVIQLERSLNENLRSLAGAKNFEDTVMSLAAAIHLLNTRLGKRPEETPQVDLGHLPSQGRAA